MEDKKENMNKDELKLAIIRWVMAMEDERHLRFLLRAVKEMLHSEK